METTQKDAILGRVGDATKLALIPTAGLYLLGFLCVTAYLSRFGIVSFDVINARYLIAGFFPFIAIGASIALCFYFRSVIIERELFTIANSGKRYFIYGLFLLVVHSISSVLTMLFSSGRYREPAGVSTVQHAALGEFDFPGKILEHLPPDPSSDLAPVVKLTLHIASYSAVLILLMWLTVKLLAPVIRRQRDLRASAKTATSVHAATSVTPVSDRFKSAKIVAVIVLESLFYSLLIALFFYSQQRMRAALFDFGSFGRPMELTSGLVFSWFFILVLWTFLAICLLPRDIKTALHFEELQKLLHPDAMWNLGVLVIVPFLGWSYVFGAAIFPRIPFAIGGGEPREVVIKTRDSNVNHGADHFFLLGESSQFVYAVVIGEGDALALQINKNSIDYIEMKRRSFVQEAPGIDLP